MSVAPTSSEETAIVRALGREADMMLVRSVMQRIGVELPAHPPYRKKSYAAVERAAQNLFKQAVELDFSGLILLGSWFLATGKLGSSRLDDALNCASRARYRAEHRGDGEVEVADRLRTNVLLLRRQ